MIRSIEYRIEKKRIQIGNKYIIFIMLQKLVDLLVEVKKTESFFLVIKYNQLLKMVQEVGLDLDEDELYQVIYSYREVYKVIYSYRELYQVICSYRELYQVN